MDYPLYRKFIYSSNIINKYMKFRINKFSQNFFSIIYALALCLLISSSGAIDMQEESEKYPSFEKFIHNYDKVYERQEEYLKREQTYLHNIETIKNSHCTSCGVNYYTDWTV